jgi:hypothetical protein
VDGGTVSATLQSFTPSASAAWAAAGLNIGGVMDFWTSDTAGDHVVLSTVGGQLEYVSTAGAGLVNIDTAPVNFGYLTKPGTNVIYTTIAKALSTAPVAGTPVTELVAAPSVAILRAVSPDEKFVVYHKATDAMGFGSDLYLADTATKDQTPVTLVPNTTGALFGLTPNGDTFSTDSSHVLFITSLDTAHGVGNLNSLAVAGGTAQQISTVVWQNISGPGSKVVFNDNCANCSGSPNSPLGQADIKVVDVAGAASPVVIQKGADANLYTNQARDTILYTYSSNPAVSPDAGPPPAGGNGVWAVKIP